LEVHQHEVINVISELSTIRLFSYLLLALYTVYTRNNITGNNKISGKQSKKYTVHQSPPKYKNE